MTVMLDAAASAGALMLPKAVALLVSSGAAGGRAALAGSLYVRSPSNPSVVSADAL